MWTYEKKLQYPVKIKCPNPAIAKIVITQYGGPDGELGASMRYLSQRYTMPYKQAIGVLNDIGISLYKLRILIYSIRIN
ncbi:MAG: manganese catalase family protein, partial [Bacillota bacterium]